MRTKTSTKVRKANLQKANLARWAKRAAAVQEPTRDPTVSVNDVSDVKYVSEVNDVNVNDVHEVRRLLEKIPEPVITPKLIKTHYYYQSEQNEHDETESFEERCRKMMTRDKFPQYYCANCFDPLPTVRGGAHGVDTDEIICVTMKPPQPLQTNSTTSESTRSKTTTSKKVLDVLTSIYKLDYLKEDDDESQIFLCNPCVNILTNLYKFYDQFNQRRQQQSFLGKKIQKLESIKNKKNNNNNINFETVKNDDDDPLHLIIVNNLKNVEEGDDDPLSNLNPISNDFCHNKSTQLSPDYTELNYGDVKDEDASSNDDVVDEPYNDADDLLCYEELKEEKDEIDMMDENYEKIPQLNDVATLTPKDNDEEDTTAHDVPSIEISSVTNENGPDSLLQESKSFSSPSSVPSEKRKISPKKHDASSIKDNNNVRKNDTKEIRTYICKMCRHVSFTMSNFREHSRQHNGTKEFPIKCALCDKRCRTLAQLKVHLLDHSNLRPVVCPKCPKTFKTINSLRNHDYYCHTDEPLLGCIYCYKKLKKKDLPPHTARHVQNGDPPKGTQQHQCPLCDKWYGTKHRLRYHLLTHTGQNPLCQVCGKMIRSQAALKQHMVSHIEERNFKCDSCPKSFKTSKELGDHHKSHEERQFLCEICSKRFVRIDQLKTHVNGVHWGAKTKKCPHCPEAFVYHFQIKNHLQTHQHDPAGS